MASRTRIGLIVGVLLLAVAAAAWFVSSGSSQVEQGSNKVRPQVGLLTSLPIYWPDGASIADLVDHGGELPWVRTSLERDYSITPLDTLSVIESEGQASIDPLAGLDRLLIVQPRGISPHDNVALDIWVREGGRLLVVIDPLLTGIYSVPLGDPAHPTIVGLVPNAFARWGIGITFYEGQEMVAREADYGAGKIPVLLSGVIEPRDARADASIEDIAARGRCEILGDGIAARCLVGKGRVTAVADAALFELVEPVEDAELQLRALVKYAFE